MRQVWIIQRNFNLFAFWFFIEFPIRSFFDFPTKYLILMQLQKFNFNFVLFINQFCLEYFEFEFQIKFYLFSFVKTDGLSTNTYIILIYLFFIKLLLILYIFFCFIMNFDKLLQFHIWINKLFAFSTQTPYYCKILYIRKFYFY